MGAELAKDMIQVFISYSPNDNSDCEKLQNHLEPMKHQGLIELWCDKYIVAGEERANLINNKLCHADIIILLISPDFIASRYCYEVEMKEAITRHERKEAVVIPVILRPCRWEKGLPFSQLKAANKDGKSVKEYGEDFDLAFCEIANNIAKTVENILHNRNEAANTKQKPPTQLSLCTSTSPKSKLVIIFIIILAIILSNKDKNIINQDLSEKKIDKSLKIEQSNWMQRNCDWNFLSPVELLSQGGHNDCEIVYDIPIKPPYKVAVDVLLKDGDHKAAIIFNDDGISFYQFEIEAKFPPNKGYVALWDSTQWDKSIHSKEIDILPNKITSISIEVYDTQTVFYANNMKLFSYQSSIRPDTKVGLRSAWTKAEFRNFSIIKL